MKIVQFSFPLIKRAFESWVDGTRYNNLKYCAQIWVIWIILNLIKIESAQSEASIYVYWTYNRICALDINFNNDEGCTRIKPALLFSAAELKQSELTIRSRRTPLPETTRNIQTNDLTLLPLVRKLSLNWKHSTDYCIFNEIQNDCLTKTLVFLARVELKKIKSSLRRLN